MKALPTGESDCEDVKKEVLDLELKEVHDLEVFEEQQLQKSNAWQMILQIALTVVPLAVLWLRGLISSTVLLAMLTAVLIVVLLLNLFFVARARKRGAA